MIPAAVCALAFIAFEAREAPSNQNPFRGSGEMTTKPPDAVSGFTLDKLHGLPMTRPVLPAQPRVWVYQQPVVVYPTYTYGVGGYRPPGVGGYYRPWGVWWVR